MSKINDLTGQSFGKLTVLNFVKTSKRKAIWACKCSCGTLKDVPSTYLTTGDTKSCGCLRTIGKTTHGQSRKKFYNTWQGIKQRCTNSKNFAYKDYGGRGIKICDEWLYNPLAFIEWCNIQPNNNLDYTLDRINNDGNYEPSNCRFISLKDQQQNRRPMKSNSEYEALDKINKCLILMLLISNEQTKCNQML